MPIYMNYEGIKGSATAEGYKDWIELVSAALGESRFTAPAATPTAGRDKSSLSGISIIKYQDSASVNLFEQFVHGGGKLAKIHWCKLENGKLTVLQKVVLEDCSIDYFDENSHGGDLYSRPMEHLTLGFKKTTLNGAAMVAKDKSMHAILDQALRGPRQLA
jgi:type VI secretion system secreted protein Hcp